MRLLSAVVRVLEREGIAFALIGAGAMAARGVARSTLDVDLLTTDSRVLAESFWKGLPEVVAIDLRRGDADDPLAGVIRFQSAGERDVDLVVGRFDWQADIVRRGTPVMVAGLPLPVAGVADLILLKLYAGGAQDAWDIGQLLASAPDPQVAADVEDRLARLPASALTQWKRIHAA